jgi:hypothetical protein
MNYGNWHQIFSQKCANYDYFTCRRALYDCHDTLALRRDLPTDDNYYIKLWAEIDALRERQHQLTKGKK